MSLDPHGTISLLLVRYLCSLIPENPFDVTIQVAEVTDAEPFPEANKPEMTKLYLDTGEETVQSAAQLGGELY